MFAVSPAGPSALGILLRFIGRLRNDNITTFAKELRHNFCGQSLVQARGGTWNLVARS